MTRMTSRACRAAFGLVAAGLLLLPHQPAEASGIGMTGLTIDFTKPDEARNLARWDDMDIIQCGPQGLGWGGEKRKDRNTSRPATVRTIVPMGIGASWRPSRNAQIAVKLAWKGEHAARAHGHLYVRYGCDGEHWSEWRNVPRVRTAKLQAQKEYRTELRVRNADRAAYDELLSEYAKRDDVPWKSDEEAAVTWLLEKRPDFLERARPFIGYVEFLYETEFRGGTHLASLEANVIWVLPGAHYPPKDKQARAGREGPWCWKADYSHQTQRSGHRTRWSRAVYEAALKHAAKGAREPTHPLKRLVLMSQTSSMADLVVPWPAGRDDPRVNGVVSRLPRQLLRSFERATTRVNWVPSGIDIGVPVVLFAWERYEPLATQLGLGWRAFYERWPNSKGVFWVSGVGFHSPEDGPRQALVHVGRMYGLLAGYGTFYLLEFRDKRWVVIEQQVTWVS